MKYSPAQSCLLALFFSWALPAVAQTSSKATGEAAIGFVYNSDDSFRFGQFSGLVNEGATAVGSVNFKGNSADSAPRYWALAARDIGLKTSSLRASYALPGTFSTFFTFEQIPHYRFDDGNTVFFGSGTAFQTLPANWVGANSTSGFSTLNANLKPFSIHKERERIKTGFDWQLDQFWKLSTEYRHETKDGNETLGAIFGSTGGNPRGGILARPIEFQTDDMLVALAYSNLKSQIVVSYNAILFSNKQSDLSWQNPFNNNAWAAGSNFSDGAVGQMALEPDNRSSQFTVSGGHSFDSGTRFSGSVSSSTLRQDDSFLPYSNVQQALVPLPRTDLGGKVENLVANLNFSKRLHQRSNLRISYDYRDRDNKTPQAIYLRIAGDSAAQGTLLSDSARINRTYDLESSRIGADIDYRLGGRNKISAGYEFEEKDRTMVDVATTEENTVFLKLAFTPSAIANGWIKASRAQRDGSSYTSNQGFISGHNPDYINTLVGNDLFENDPLMRRFHLADRDRDELSANLNIYPNDVIGVSLLAKFSADDFPETKIGLRESDKRHFAADLSYSPQESWQASLYYNYETYVNKQAGYARSGGGNPTPFYPESVRIPERNWLMDSEDDIHTIGGGVDWLLLDDRLDLSMDFSVSRALTETSPYSAGVAYLPIPDVVTDINNFTLSGKYMVQEGKHLLLRYQYQRYDADDFALDGINVSTLANVLLPGNQSPKYAAHLLMLSLSLTF